ncbi:unnamed protein product (macronuclear) [Paramecium tetraurelia]|uniref:Uncharacterized protein n=1 Tax=Paramecium tetraurelia TaxID=5888 RepID=A0BYZ1_PARTE|nr:uncharacterized protein GSPATT00033611001 [Paramecium tetraurelia]CAK63758.1 unnamed protein product [Paramecium tetraurelia]|eukprot:XP_001431156.1 hypothetical protein (macronuclear) [Paramecium tetraurelia strain d4-2]
MSSDIKKQMNDFRKAHFTVGFDKSSGSTNYVDDYTAKKPDKELPTTEEAKHFEAYIANPRKAHFELGEDNVNYQSIAKLSFNPKESQKAQLSEETQKDLRNHHFKLGFHSVPSETEYSQYKNQPLDIQKKQQVNIRKHHHDFGDLKTYFTTTYQDTNKEYHVQKEEYHAPDIRKTNINIGNNPMDYTTHYARYHDGQQNPQTHNKGNLEKFLKESHLVLGEDPTVKSSQNKDAFQGQQNKEVIRVNKEVLLDLRTAHFDFAYQKAEMPQTTKQSMFQKTAIAVSQPNLPTSSLTIGTHGFLNDRYYQTSYATNYANPNTQKPELVKDPRITAVKFGDEQVDYNTENNRNYQIPEKVDQFKLDRNQIRDLRQHHFQLGTDPIEYPSKTSQITPQPNALSEDQLKDLRRQHFVYGSQIGTYNTHNSEYGTRQGPPNKLDAQLQKDLRMHHFEEDGERGFQTSYRAMQPTQ